MKFIHTILVITLLTAGTLPAAAQEIKVKTREGGSVVTYLESGSRLNDTSSLKRTWIVLNDTSSPAKISDAGLNTKHQDGNFLFEPSGWVNPSEPVSAVNVRFVLYDMFGNHMETLSGTIVEDFGPETSFDLRRLGFWPAGKFQAKELLTIAVFVADVRTQGEKVWTYSPFSIRSKLNALGLATHADMLEPLE